MKKIMITLPNDIHKLLKLAAACYDQTMQEFIIEALENSVADLRSKLTGKDIGIKFNTEIIISESDIADI